MSIDWRNRDSDTVPSHNLMPGVAALIEWIRGGTNETVAICCDENTPSPPYALGSVARACAYFGRASYLAAVWRTEH
eukprot:3498169-Ditylum_brightwellii.AAC.1